MSVAWIFTTQYGLAVDTDEVPPGGWVITNKDGTLALTQDGYAVWCVDLNSAIMVLRGQSGSECLSYKRS